MQGIKELVAGTIERHQTHSYQLTVDDALSVVGGNAQHGLGESEARTLCRRSKFSALAAGIEQIHHTWVESLTALGDHFRRRAFSTLTDELELLRFIDQLQYDCGDCIVIAGFSQEDIGAGVESALSVRLIDACGPKENRSVLVKLSQFLAKLDSRSFGELARDHVQIIISRTSNP